MTCPFLCEQPGEPTSPVPAPSLHTCLSDVWNAVPILLALLGLLPKVWLMRLSWVSVTSPPAWTSFQATSSLASWGRAACLVYIPVSFSQTECPKGRDCVVSKLSFSSQCPVQVLVDHQYQLAADEYLQVGDDRVLKVVWLSCPRNLLSIGFVLSCTLQANVTKSVRQIQTTKSCDPTHSLWPLPVGPVATPGEGSATGCAKKKDAPPHSKKN